MHRSAGWASASGRAIENGHRLDPKVRCSVKTRHSNAGFWMYRGADAMPPTRSSAASAWGPPEITAGSTSSAYFQ